MHKIIVLLGILLLGVVIGRTTPRFFSVTQASVETVKTIPLPEGCERIYADKGVRSRWKRHRITKTLFVQCVLKGKWVVLTTITADGAKMGKPMKAK